MVVVHGAFGTRHADVLLFFLDGLGQVGLGVQAHRPEVGNHTWILHINIEIVVLLRLLSLIVNEELSLVDSVNQILNRRFSLLSLVIIFSSGARLFARLYISKYVDEVLLLQHLCDLLVQVHLLFLNVVEYVNELLQLLFEVVV